MVEEPPCRGFLVTILRNSGRYTCAMLLIDQITPNIEAQYVILPSMLSAPSYFKLTRQLRLAAEYDPSTCIEFELRCNSAAQTFAVYNTGGIIIFPGVPRKHRLAVGSRSNANLITARSAQPPRACPRTALPVRIPLSPTEPTARRPSLT